MLLGETTQEILELGTTEDKILQVIKNNPKVTGRELTAIIGVMEDGIK